MSALEQLKIIFNIKERDFLIYKSISLHNRPVSVTDLSKIVDLPKSTLYDHLKNLMKEGLIESNGAYGKRYFPTSLDALGEILNRRLQYNQKQEELFQTIRPKLEHEITQKAFPPKFTYSEGAEALLLAYYSSLQTEEKLLRFVFPENKMFQQLGSSTLADYHQKRLRKKIFARVLATEANVTDNSYLVSSQPALREVKLLPHHHEFTASIIIFDDTVHFFTLESQLISARVTNREFAQTMRVMFDAIWEK